MQQPPWMPLAYAELGQHEIGGSRTNPKIAAYFRRAGHPEISDDETPWCAAFVGAMLEQSGIRGSRSLAARSYMNWGVEMGKPSFGAITVLSRGGDPSLGHVGFLVGSTSTTVTLLGGNQSDAVSTATFDRSRVLGFRLPSAAEIPIASEMSGTRTKSAQPAATSDADFAAALTHVLAFEGGWSDDPLDPGGATNKGITISAFARERGVVITAQNIADLKAELRRIPDGEVRHIYLERYWRLAHCPELPPPLALFHFDCAVNQGVAGSARMLQEALGVTIDAEIGPATHEAILAIDTAEIIDRYADVRRRRYRRLSTFWRFGRGWLRRVDAIQAAAHALAKNHPETTRPEPKRSTSTMPDTNTSTPTSAQQSGAKLPTKWWGESLTIWGTLITTVSTVAPTLLKVFGIDLPADVLQSFGAQVVTAAQAIGGLAGTTMTILGRLRATTSLERRSVSLYL